MPARPDFRDPAFLRGHIETTLAFYRPHAQDPSGGFFHFFKDDGQIYDRRTRHLVSSTRFVFNHATAWRGFGRDEDFAAMLHGWHFLQQVHAQADGAHAWLLDWDGERARVLDPTQHCYGLAFVVLAHAHALMAGHAPARAALDAACRTAEAHFWEPQHGLYADEADAAWVLGDYRGQNANMHMCEAMLAAHEASAEPRHLERALTLADSVTRRLASAAGGLVWEHYHADWQPDWDYNRDNPAHLFRPWGFQTGHLSEWAKLLLQLEARLPPAQREPWLLERARALFDAAMRQGWDARHGGLVYGFAPDGKVCDGDKYFWVQAESLAAAALLALRSGDADYWDWYERIWDFSWRHFVDHRWGAWYRILGPDNRKLSDEKSPAGKTDYHTMGACWDVLRGLGHGLPYPAASP